MNYSFSIGLKIRLKNYFFDFKNEIMVRIRNIKNSIFAISVAPAAMPPKPNTAAMMAIIKNVTVY
jgi:hypothetical protein